METSAPKNKAIEFPPKQKFHFAGTPDYKPMTVEALDADEAKELWLKLREPVKNINS